MWDLIPNDTDVLITHGPPFGILDKNTDNENCGCEELLLAINRIKPKIHIFGHIHEAYGEIKLNGTHFINPSSCDVRYVPRQQPIVVDYTFGEPVQQAPKIFEMSDPVVSQNTKTKKKDLSDKVEEESSEEEEEEEEEPSDQEDIEGEDEDFKWYNHEKMKDNSYFVFVNCDRRKVKKGEQVFYCYGKRSNAFLLLK